MLLYTWVKLLSRPTMLQLVTPPLFALLMTIFLPSSEALLRRGGQNPWPTSKVGSKTLDFGKCKLLTLLFLPPRGAKLRCQIRWGPWPDFPSGSAAVRL